MSSVGIEVSLQITNQKLFISHAVHYNTLTKIDYTNTSIHASTRSLLDKIIPIIKDYEERGYRMTVRQLYYQLVSRNIVTNEISSYQKTSKVLTTGRMHGLIDWNMIVDRIRVPIMPSQFYTLGLFIHAVKRSYRRHRWDDQENYVEVMVEKEALVGILGPITDKYHVSLLVNKGYASASAMHDVAIRMQQHSDEKRCYILYMGDHDPSGIDMVRDIRDRLETFGQKPTIQRIALTEEQIKQYDPPPNPAKKSDPRSKGYYEKYGDSSWELDALDPQVLASILEDNIKKYLDEEKYNAVIQKEDQEKDALEKLTDEL